MNKILLSLSLAFSMTACSALEKSAVPQLPQATYQFDSQKKCPNPLNMKVGETLHLSVDENLSTGYAWELQANEQVEVQTLYASQFVPPKPEEAMMVGRGDVKIYRVTAVKPGEVVLNAYFGRGWMPQEAAQWSCHIQIQ